MDRFRPSVTQTKNFQDPLNEYLVHGNQSISSGSNQRYPGIAKNYCSTHKKNKFGRRLLGGSVPYSQEWELICGSVESKEIFQWALNGELPACRFRSICWRVFLRIFPLEVSKWLSVLREKREDYQSTHLKFMVTPGSIDQALDPSVNNPLSQDEESPWNQYFEDHDLKKIIRLDVQRTFPEIDFFQLQRIQDMMVSILFCYVRKNPKTTYIQGMHEVLAPLIFVLNNDHVAHVQSLEEDTPTLLKELMDQTYLEHDSFALFERVMGRLQHWYEDSEVRSESHPRPTPQIIQVEPFARPQDIGTVNKIGAKLTKIHDGLLKQYESDLYAHLSKLEILPQVYGIRWARLMFGREFSLTDLLMIWDAIFADDDDKFSLMEYLMVAMLSYIKEDILKSDEIQALNLLMRYPSDADVESITKLAYHFKNFETATRLSRNNPDVRISPNTHKWSLHSSLQPTFTRSSSLPRPNIMSNSSSNFKQRSTSVDHRPRSSGNVRHKKSPTVEAIDSLTGFSFSKGTSPLSEEQNFSHLENEANNAANKVVTGFVRFGERFTRQKEILNGEQNETGPIEKPMDELSCIKRSAPIPTYKKSIYDNVASSTESEDNPNFPKKHVNRSRRPSAEDLMAVILGCALQLSNHQTTLSNRLSQLKVESDITVRTSLEGITEVVESLRELRMRPKPTASPERILRNCSPVNRSEGSSPCPFPHPLMDHDDT